MPQRSTRWTLAAAPAAAVLIVALLVPATRASAEEAEKQPPPPAQRQRGDGRERGPTAAPPPGQMIDQFRNALAGLDLSDDQKTKIEAALKTAADDFRELRENVESMEPRDRRERVSGIFDTLRQEVHGILDEQQRQALRKKMEQFRPAGGQRPGGEGTGATGAGPTTRPGPLLEQLQRNLEKLELSDDQKKKIDAVFADVREQMAELREGLMSGDEAAREKVGQIGMDVRRQLGEILTEDQRRQLREMTGTFGGPGGRPQREGNRPRRPGAGGDDDEMMRGGDEENMMRPDGEGQRPRPGQQRPQRNPRRPRPPTTAPAPGSGATIGSPAPDFELAKLDGKPVRLSTFQGRVGVIVFGSYSSPSFRQRAPALDALARQYGNRAQFLIVYTKEAHPAGEWDVERNKDEGISVPPHADADARLAEARKAKDKLKLTTIPLAVDTMDDAVAGAFGLFPNGAVVLSRDGQILARQQWVDPDGLERRIEQALKVPATKPAAT